ncbi:MAG: dynamin family protein [Peptostreptococcaceae bacterium]|nr:dynamin family protein [Peptostreptococcaceae bacterium]
MSTIYEIAKESMNLLGSSEITAAEHAKACELINKLENQSITVSVIGQFKRGKSTLVNTILGEKLLPVGLIPVTSAVTIIKYGDKGVTVHFLNGVNKLIEFDELPDYISEEKNPNNVYGVSHVTITTPSPFLADGLSFVDTPGVGSIHKHNSTAAYAFVKESDAVIFMLSVDSPINEIEVEFLENAKDYAGKFYFAVNKIDGISDFELKSYLSYCEANIKKIMNTDNITLYPMSARENIGLAELKDKIVSDIKSEMSNILDESVRMKLIYTIKSSLTQLDLYWNALTMPIGRLENRLRIIHDCLEVIEKDADETVLHSGKSGKAFAHQLAGNIGSRKLDLEKVEEKEKKSRFESVATEILEDSIDDISAFMSNITKHHETKFNELKMQLSGDVSENFGMDYHYDLDEINYDESKCHDTIKFSEFDASKYAENFDIDGTLEELKAIANSALIDNMNTTCNEFILRVTSLTEDLSRTLKKIMLYKEDNAMTVWQYINDISKLVKHLRSNRDTLLKK